MAGTLPVGGGSYELSDQSAATATGGRIDTGAIFNISGGSFGLVKTLALAGIGFILWRVLSRK